MANDFCISCRNRFVFSWTDCWCWKDGELIGDYCYLNWDKCKGKYWEKGDPCYIVG
jgi:hypothetical protein